MKLLGMWRDAYRLTIREIKAETERMRDCELPWRPETWRRDATYAGLSPKDKSHTN